MPAQKGSTSSFFDDIFQFSIAVHLARCPCKLAQPAQFPVSSHRALWHLSELSVYYLSVSDRVLSHFQIGGLNENPIPSTNQSSGKGHEGSRDSVMTKTTMHDAAVMEYILLRRLPRENSLFWYRPVAKIRSENREACSVLDCQKPKLSGTVHSI